jgi:phenylpropionate dioxygenase-like ring-hydroxylating dioxygenase large terminal subunit
MSVPKSRDVFPGNQGYPRNAWWVAAYSREVTDQPMARTYLDTPVVLYRTRDGEAVALHDRCPHRAMPLSMGSVQEGDLLQCGYHGIRFKRDGTCAAVPSQDAVPASLNVRRYPLVEKWNWLWIWMGDPEKADPLLIPDHKWLGLELEGYHPTAGFMLELGCNYQFMHDNLIDSTHFSYLHAGVIDTGDLAGARFWTEEDGRTLRLGREQQAVRFPPAMALYFRVDKDRAYDRRMVTEAYVPSTAIGKQTLRESANADARPVELYAINATTPATRRLTYLFHVQITSFDAKWSDPELDFMKYIVVQDKIALEAIQKRFDEFGEDTEVSVKADISGVRLRRMISSMIKEESPTA